MPTELCVGAVPVCNRDICHGVEHASHDVCVHSHAQVGWGEQQVQRPNSAMCADEYSPDKCSGPFTVLLF